MHLKRTCGRREFSTTPCNNAPVLDWDDFRFLLSIRENGSASSAARKLGVDKATVARRVTSLEQELAVRLLVRRASGWQPTAAGERAAHLAREIERRISELRSDYASEHGSPRTPVTVTAPHWFCSELLLPNLPKLLSEGPWLDISIAATSRVLNLPQREADVALRNTRPEHGEFMVRRAGELGSALYVSKGYAKRHSPPRTREEWARHRVVGYPDRVTYVPGFRWFDEIGARSIGLVRTDDAKSLVEALKAGIGVGVIPCFLGDRERDLVRFADELHRETIWLVSPVEAAGTRAVKMTSAFVGGLFREHARALNG
jgi:DNA-binding transcriptional LysR family regulator